MVRVTVNVSRGRAPAAAAGLSRGTVFGVTGTTTHRPAAGAAYTVPPVGEIFLLESEADHARVGSYSEGTLGQAVAAVEAHGEWRIIGVRHDEGALAFYAGTSLDAVPNAAELGISGEDGEAVIAAHVGAMYDLIAVPATEPDITRVFYSTNPNNNVVGDFTKFGQTVIPAGDTRPHNVWVSNAASALAADVTISVGILTAVGAMELLEDAEAAVNYAPNRVMTGDRMHNLDAMGNVDNSSANDLAVKMAEVCADLGALGYANGPGASNADFTGWLAVNYSEHLVGCGPYARLAGETEDMAMGPLWAAAHAARVRDIGFWANPHGANVIGVVSLSRPIVYNPRSASSVSSVLTAANGVSMFFRNGYHLLGGSLMVDPTDEDAAQRITTRLILDDVQAHSGAAGDRAVEDNVGPDLIDFATNIVHNRLSTLLGLRAINSFTVAPDVEANTDAELAAGNVHFNVDFDAVKNARNVIFNIYYT